MIENLTKENFWNEIEQKYPKAMKKFCDWIDEYKKKNAFEVLFACTIRTEWYPSHPIFRIPKYHELPLAFQYGIFCEYIYDMCIEEGREVIPTSIFVGKTLLEEMVESVNETFKIDEEELNG